MFLCFLPTSLSKSRVERSGESPPHSRAKEAQAPREVTPQDPEEAPRKQPRELELCINLRSFSSLDHPAVLHYGEFALFKRRMSKCETQHNNVENRLHVLSWWRDPSALSPVLQDGQLVDEAESVVMAIHAAFLPLLFQILPRQGGHFARRRKRQATRDHGYEVLDLGWKMQNKLSGSLSRLCAYNRHICYW